MSIDEVEMNDNLKPVNRVAEIDDDIMDNNIDIIFRGNYKLNFNERLKDKDLLFLVQVLDMEMENIHDRIRHIDLSYNNLTDSSVVELINFIKKCSYVRSLNL